ncbi:M28 family peptidase [Salicibibacter cibarius]|uniref:M28 family peptidase n=1 Tax=Salicibibacter cibarius TaxID=2743000 RepID=A0A7T6Z518_9BACI|nr:M28 family peptidase [Salicibibacter cibarius]QQK76511.1 M28 family peptidase [Salicibibacter cibarius]
MKKIGWKKTLPAAFLLSMLPATGLNAQENEDEEDFDPVEAIEALEEIQEIEDDEAETMTAEDDEYDPEDFIRYDDLLPELEQIEEESDGELDIDVLGQSQNDRDIYSARIGSGDQVILITSEIHGNENFGTESLIQLLDTLGTSDSDDVQTILNEVTIVTVPKFNPDGSELVQRQNDITWDEVEENHPQLEGAEPAWNFNENFPGFDINRDFNADLDYEPQAEDLPGTTAHFGFFLTNESQILTELYQDLQDEFGHVDAYVDLHQMGAQNQIEGTDEDVTIAIDYPALGPDDNPRYADDYPEWDQDQSRSYALAAANGVNERAEGDVEPGLSRYVHHSTRDLPGQGRHAFALNGTATVLFEMPGQQPETPYDQELIDIQEDGVWGILEHMADGSVDDELDGDDFYELPKYWPDTPDVSDPDQYSTDFTEYDVGEAPADWSPIWQGDEDQFTVLDEPNRLQHITESGIRGFTPDEVGDIYGDTQIFGLVRGDEIHETLFELGFHMSGAPESENAIYADAQMPDADSDENSVRIMQRSGGSTETLDSAELPFELEEDNWYRVLLQRQAEALQVKMWPDGEEEPEEWQVTTTESTMFGGQVGISHSTPGMVNDYAYIGVGIGGEEAPHAPDDHLEPEPREDVTADDMIEMIEQLDEAGEFSSDEAVRALTTHLGSISHYEDQEDAEKVIQHMEGFHDLLDQQFEDELISENAYTTLQDAADQLMAKWGVLAFDAENSLEHIDYLSEDIGVRYAGTDEEKEAADYIKNEFEDLGYPVEVQEFNIDEEDEQRLDQLTMVSSGDGEVPLRSALGSAETDEEGITADVIDVAYGEEDDFPDEVEGNIALIQRGEASFLDAANRASEAGAVGLIIADDTDDLRAFRPGLSDETADIPVVGVTQEDGETLRSEISEDGLTVNLSVQTMTDEISQNVIAVKEPEEDIEDPEIVYVTAHYDSVAFSPGANDNASGTAHILELARTMQDISVDKEIRFIAFGYEEGGLNGSRHYVDELSQSEIDNSAANFNFDMVGTDWEEATSLNVNVVDGEPNVVWDYADAAADRLDFDALTLFERGASDHESFYDVGIDAANISWREPGTGELEPTYHTPYDTIDLISEERIQTHGELVSSAILDMVR